VTYGSFDYTSLLYLSDYLEDFGGGRFVFMEEGANKTVEPRAGRISRLAGGWVRARDPCPSTSPVTSIYTCVDIHVHVCCGVGPVLLRAML
jgi:hypothetical protein